MRTTGPPSEIRRLAAPLLRALDGAWQRMHWWIAAMAVLYAVSGVTTVKPDEVALILRWGRLLGGAPASQQHGPGLLLALPRPIDEVVRVKVKRVSELTMTSLAAGAGRGAVSTLDPLTDGYALSGDRNIVHVEMVAHYRVRDPAEWALYGPGTEEALRVEATAAMVRSLGEMGIDRILSDGRKELVATAFRRAQEGLDAARSGLELTSLELTRLAPPAALAADFDAVQSAYIGAETEKMRAEGFRQSVIPGAQAAADQEVQSARAAAATELAQATGEAEAFRALEREYRTNPAVIRERLYRDAVERAVHSAGAVRWVPPPAGRLYHGLRISIVPPAAASAPGEGELPP